MKQFTPLSFLGRLLLAAGVVLLTYNPTGFSYLRWLKDSVEARTFGAQQVFASVVVAIGWTILVRATYRSLGPLGMLLGAAFFGTLIWLLVSVGILSIEARSTVTWVALISLSGLLAVGVSWSHIRRRLTGQLDVDEVDE